MIYQNVLQLIGHTPLIKLQSKSWNTKVDLFVKMECFNPGGSVKDRIALNMIEDAENRGLITQNSHIIEATSGNTGIGLALVCAVKGYPITLVMPESMSIERRKMLHSYGAELILTPKELGMQGSIKKLRELVKENSNYVHLKQFENPANPNAHRIGTALEIWKDMEQNLDIFIAGIGTGGTITGVGETLKNFNPEIKIIGVEPMNSAVLSGKSPGFHSIQGIGAGFVPQILNREIIDKIITISDEEAFLTARKLVKNEAIFVGISSGAALAAAFKSLKMYPKAKRVVILLPDSGERYLSTL